VPIAFGLGYIARRQADSLVTLSNRPRLRTVLRNATQILLLDWFATLIVGLLLRERSVSEPPSLYSPDDRGTFLWQLLERIPLLGVELFYVFLMSVVFLQASGPHTPTRKLRTRNLAFFFGTTCLLAIELVELSFPLTGYLLPATLAASAYAELTVLQAFLFLCSAAFWLYGLSKHLSRTEIDIWLSQAQQWSQLRELLGLARSRVSFVSELPIATHKHHLTVAAKSLGMGDRSRAKVIATLEMTCVLEPKQKLALEKRFGLRVERKDLLKCAVLQDQLIRKQDLSGPFKAFSASSDSTSQTIAYDINHDTLYEVLRPVLWLANGGRNLDFRRCPRWLQLAAVAASQAGVLDAESRDRILKGKVIDPKVIETYSLVQESSSEHWRSTASTRFP
jgi:hypothetical protein